MVENLQAASRARMIEDQRRAPTHPVWGGPGWTVFLYTQADLTRILEYIRMNPIKAGRPEQHWAFVKKYDSWLPGQWRK